MPPRRPWCDWRNVVEIPEPGDIIFCHSKGLVGWFIRLGQRMRSPLSDAYWNHVAIMAYPDPDGTPRVIQAAGAGVEYLPLRHLDCEYIAVSAERFPGVLSAAVDRDAVVNQAHALVGDHYGWLTILSIIVNILTPKWFHFPAFRRGGTFICSALAAWCLHAGGADINAYDIYQVTPAELAAIPLTA